MRMKWILIATLWSPIALALPVSLPGSIEPGRISKTLEASPAVPQALPPAPAPSPEKLAPLQGPAASIQFPLKKIILTGNTVFSDQQLQALYQDKLNKTITIAELQNIVQTITHFYRNQGYLLSRAILPPQHIVHGIVQIHIIEGYFDNVSIQGKPKGAAHLLSAYADHIQRSRPMQLKTVERYLYLANEIPGLQAESIITPSQTQNTGQSDLAIKAHQSLMNGYFAYDNYESRYLGPLEMTGNINANSIFISGDSTHITYLNSTHWNELNYFEGAYEFPIGTEGMRLLLGGSHTNTLSGFTLSPLHIQGNTQRYYTTLSYPLVRSRTQDITLDAGFNYLNSDVTLLGQPFYTDHLRTFKVGGHYDFYDALQGANLISLHVEKGLPLLGATTNTNTTNTSRFEATGNFVKLTAQLSRQQTLYKRFSAFAVVDSQYSFEPLLASEQFGYGGAQLGRGYDPSELLGDRGLAGSIELRMNTYPEWKFLKTTQFFIFYDAGVVWNIKHIAGTLYKDSATSTGIGLRMAFTKNISGTGLIAQPLTRQESTLAMIGKGRAPRALFNVVVSF